MKVHTIGIDLGKTSFHLIGMDERGNIVLRRRFSRTQLAIYTSKLDACLIGMEACGGSNILGRTLKAQGHTVRLIPAQFVRPFVKSNKNDYNDAEAIAEAVQKPNVRFVPIKTEDQLDLQAIHRTRERFVAQRTRVINQIRACLLERGIVLRTGRLYLQRQMASILEDGEQRLSGLARGYSTCFGRSGSISIYRLRSCNSGSKRLPNRMRIVSAWWRSPASALWPRH
jgi:transposase